jgi:hypothetical protein
VDQVAPSTSGTAACSLGPGSTIPSGNGNQYQGVKYTGVVDEFRVLKPGAAIYQAQADPLVTPVIAPAFYWDFGPVSPVTSLPGAMICSNLDRLEVYVGGQHFATATPDSGQYASLPYRRRSWISARWMARLGLNCASTAISVRPWLPPARFPRTRPATGCP